MDRKKRLLLNTSSSFVFQITTIICGFILPRLIINSFGSEVNGLVASISQFLGVISFLELGMGAVVQSSLYKPLAASDYEKISQIVTSAEKFFRRLAAILLGYILILVLVYPSLADSSFDHGYTAMLLLAISISYFAQYYFGMVDRLLLTADQRGYIQYTAQTVTLVLNTAASFVLIRLGASIHLVKLTTSILYLARPVVLRLYVSRHYSVNRRARYDKEPIGQKWNGIAQHVASVVLDGTDSIVLTLFSSLSDVSVYSVYYMVIAGVKQLFLSMTNGFQSLLGELLARRETEEVNRVFGWTEWLIHGGTVFVFGCTGVLIVPFVQVYTKGILDAQYTRTVFAALLTLAHAGHCLRLPYNISILAAGHFKQTQRCYLIAAVMNIVISVATVAVWGLVGVAIGTLVAMAYQTVWMAVYTSTHIIHWPFRKFLRQLLADGLSLAGGILLTRWFTLGATTYFAWVVLALKVALVWAAVVLAVNSLFYRENVCLVARKLLRKKA